MAFSQQMGVSHKNDDESVWALFSKGNQRSGHTLISATQREAGNRFHRTQMDSPAIHQPEEVPIEWGIKFLELQP